MKSSSFKLLAREKPFAGEKSSENNKHRAVLLAAVLVQLLSISCLLPSNPLTKASFIGFMGLHLLAVVIGIRYAMSMLPERYCYPKTHAVSVLGLPMLLIPFFGLIGMSAAVMTAIRKPVEKEPEFAVAIALPELPFKPVDIDPSQGLGGGLLSVIKHDADPVRRVKAVLSTKKIADRHAVPILQLALKDPVDDVRLLAYSMLDQKENTINLKIKDTLTEIDRSTHIVRARLHKELANLFWELAYMELAQGEVLVHVLAKAREHIELSLRDKNDAGGYFLLGRILLKQGQLDLAEQALKRACEAGMEEANIASYLAEIAFHRNDYHLIPSILEALPANERIRQPVKGVAEYWLAA